MKLIQRCKNAANAVLAACMVGAGSVHAALPTAVETQLGEAVTDIGTLVGLALAVAGAAFAGFALYRRIPRG